MTDERFDMPSSSTRERDSRCPGARNLIRALRMTGHLVERTHSWTESGTRIHEAVEGKEIDLDHNEETARESVVARIAELRQALGVPVDAVELVEQRLWLRDGLRRVASGRPDKIWLYDRTAVIPDVKTGWGGVAHESVNLQLRGYAVLAYINHQEVERVIVAIAGAHGAKPHPVEYGIKELEQSRQEWLAEIAATNQPGAPRVAGDVQCNYCPAKLHCPQAQEQIPKMALTTIHETGLVVSNEDLAALLDRCGLAKKMVGEIEAEAKRRLEADPDALPGFKLVPGTNRATITNITGVFGRCGQHGVTADQFTGACSLTKAALTALLKKATGEKGKALNAIIDAVLDGMTESQQSAPQIKRASIKEIQE